MALKAGWELLSPHTHFRPSMETSVSRLADHDRCLCRHISAGLEARGTGLLLCFTRVLPLLHSPEDRCPEKPPAITLHPAGDTATPGGSCTPSPGALRSPWWVKPSFQHPTGFLGCCLNPFPQGLKSTIFLLPRIRGTGGHWRQGDESWKDSMPHHTRTFVGLARV